MPKKRKHKAGDLIRWAIIHAIEEREEYLRSIAEVDDEQYREIRLRTRELIKELKAYFVERFGFDYWQEEKDHYSKMKSVNIRDLPFMEPIDSDQD